MINKTIIGISDLNVVTAPDLLVTYALGSCIGICLYDSVAKVAGLSHIMLPSPNLVVGEVITPKSSMKYAETAIPQLIDQMILKGAMRTRIVAKIAGGAQMFATSVTSSIGNIGERNILMTREVLRKKCIRIVAEDVGLNYGRTLTFDSATGTMIIKSINKGEARF